MTPAEYLRTSPEALMAAHAKTFSFAAAVLSADQLRQVARLYQLCRVIDDCADELPPAEARACLTQFRRGIAGEASEFGEAFRQLECLGVERRHLSALIEGGLLDLEQKSVLDANGLLHYCYLVAGVVGVMMCPLLGVRDSRALPYARDLGIAMQLTNICRDVQTDSQMDRIYLPDLGAEASELASLNRTPEHVRRSLKYWLAEADVFYESAYRGLAFLPLRARFCILIAGQVYRAIGKKILANGLNVHEGRVFLRPAQKVFVALKSVPRIFYPSFWLKPKRRDALTSDAHLQMVEASYA